MKLPLPAPGLAALLLAACTPATRPALPPATGPDPVVLISIDGLRPDVLGQGHSPTLDRLAREGVRARWMSPSYPSITFPNHYTLVTGLRPDHHGLVHNMMDDPELGRFEMKNAAAVRTPGWWEGARPLWVLASRQGLRSGSWSYPGGETAIDGRLPDLVHPYDESVSPSGRAAGLLQWLGQPQPVHFIAAYFEQVDQAGHAHGPHSPQYRQALERVDAAIGELVEGLRARGQLDRVNLLVVSDHGMAKVPDGQVLALEEMADPAVARPVSAGQVIGFEPQPGREAEARAALLGRHSHHACWERDRLPAHWGYGTHPRIPSIICQMDEGWDALPKAAIARRPPGDRGSHGFDPALPSMRAVFIARGPAFRQGVELDPITNVDVQPLVGRLLGLELPPGDGDPAATAAALR